jgi:para-nitrobenzyl esterase
MKAFVMVYAAFAVISASAAESGPIARVTGGQVRGAILEKGGAVFKGIPYAAPPVGELRWREPMPVSSWASIRDATAFGPPCAQLQSLALNAARVPDAQISKEDCLYLNVWTPEWGNKAQSR